jgi:hypothetical protein
MATSTLLELIQNPDNASFEKLREGNLLKALHSCQGLDIHAAAKTDLENCCGLILKNLVDLAVAAESKPATWDTDVSMVKEIVSSVSQAVSVADSSVLSGSVLTMNLCSSAVNFKASLKVLSRDAEPSELKDLVLTALASKRSVKQMIDAEVPEGHARTIHEHMKNLHATSDSVIATKLGEARVFLVKELGKAKGKLDRVAGGLDNTKSWKESIPDESPLSEMQAGLELLANAYCQAIRSRIGTVKQVPNICNHAP